MVLFGNDVNIAKRVESLADPGGISISEVVYDQIKNNVEIQTVEVGEKELKNIKDNVNIYKVLLEAQKIENDDSDIPINVGMVSKSIDSDDTEDMPIPEKVVINDGDEKVDIKIDKEGKEITINVEKKDEKTSNSKKKEKEEEKGKGNLTSSSKKNISGILSIQNPPKPKSTFKIKTGKHVSFPLV